MTRTGICDNATFEESRLMIPQAQELGVRWRRTITYDRPGSWAATIASARDLQQIDVKTLVVFNTESYGGEVNDLDLMAQRLGEFLDQAGDAVAAIEPGNELDNPFFGIDNDLIIQIGQRAAAVCHERGILCLSPSLLRGPNEGVFEAVAQRLAGHVDAMAVHPYYCSVGGSPSNGWRFGTVEDKANTCQERGAGLSTWFTELGCPTIFDAIGMEGQANFAQALRDFQHPAIDVVMLFCLNDVMVPGAMDNPPTGEIAEGKDWGISGKPALDAYKK